MDNKKTEAGECTEENGNSFDERQESSISDKSILQVSGRDNIVLINCDVTLMLPQGNEELTPSPSLGQAGSSKAGTVDKELTPLPSLGQAGSSKAGTVDKELTTPPSLGQPGSSKAGTVDKELTTPPSLGQPGSSKAGTVVKEPKRRAPIQKEDEAPPRKKKRAGSDKPLSDKGRNMSDETPSGTSGSAGWSGRFKKSAERKKGSDKPLSDKGRNMSDETPSGTSGSAGWSGRFKKSAERKKSSDTDKENKPQVQCSTMPMVFKNVKKSRRIRVNTFDVEVESIDQNHTKKWLPGRFRPVDFSGWGHLTLLNKETGKEEPI